MIASATAGLYPFRGILDASIVALLYLLLVGFSTSVWGLGSGIATAFAAFLAFNYFFIPPYYTFWIHRSQDVLTLIVFLIVAVAISQLVGRAKSSLAQAQAREREATHLYELSAALAGVRSQEAIVPLIANRLREVFQAHVVEVAFQPSMITGAPMAYRLPEGAPPSSEKPDQVVPMTTARGWIGEIRLWRRDLAFTSTEEWLLRAFASQGALALERAWLDQAETRAKVLEASDQLKSALLSSVSHELRTPLATIRAAATSLRSGEVAWGAPASVELIAAIDDEANHLNRLVGNLLDMSRIEAGALQPQRQWNILAEIVDGVLARMRRATERHRLHIAVPEDLPFVPVDYVQMEQVFTNLLSNSLKYAPPDTTIGVGAQVQDDATVLVEVRNQGPPVPEEHLSRIFDKFYRVTEADRVTGTGLGLSICKGIIEAHDGRIWAENLPDGFAFKFSLPLKWDGAPPPRLPVESEAE